MIGKCILFIIFFSIIASTQGQSIKLDSSSRIVREFLIWKRQEKELERSVLRGVRRYLWRTRVKSIFSSRSSKLFNENINLYKQRKNLKVFLYPIGLIEDIKNKRFYTRIKEDGYLFGEIILDSMIVGTVDNGCQLKICFDSVAPLPIPPVPMYINFYPPQKDKFFRPYLTNSFRFELCAYNTIRFFMDEDGYILDYFLQIKEHTTENYNLIKECVREKY